MCSSSFAQNSCRQVYSCRQIFPLSLTRAVGGLSLRSFPRRRHLLFFLVKPPFLSMIYQSQKRSGFLQTGFPARFFDSKIARADAWTPLAVAPRTAPLAARRFPTVGASVHAYPTESQSRAALGSALPRVPAPPPRPLDDISFDIASASCFPTAHPPSRAPDSPRSPPRGCDELRVVRRRTRR